jgi:hypothetical protein
LIKNCDKELKSGYLKYYIVNGPDVWNEAISKNIATAHTSKDIIVNIDSGFIVDIECTIFIIKTFMYSKNTIIHIHTQQESGHLGHLAIPRENFVFIGGYNESLEPAGFQSIDLLNRLKKSGLKAISYLQKNVDYSLSKQSTITCGYTYSKYNRMITQNFITSKKNIAQGHLIANEKSCNENMFKSKNKFPEMKNKVSEYLKRLIEQLFANIFSSENFDLLNGQAGVAILLYHYSRYKQQDKTIQSISDKLLDIVVEKISKESEYETVSIAISICYLMKDKFIELDTSIFESVDNWIFNYKNKDGSHIDFSKKVLTGIYIYYRITFSESEDIIIWKKRMKDFFKAIHTMLYNELYRFNFPVFNCSDLSTILYLCFKFENDDDLKNEIGLIYKDLIPIIELSIREEDNNSAKYLLSWLLNNTILGLNYHPVISAWDSVTLMDINHFFLYRYILDIKVETPKIIEKEICSTINNEKYINKLLSLLTPNTSGLSSYVAGFTWALLQWDIENETKKKTS